VKIGIPVAEYHPGNTSDYVLRAFLNLGHEARILTPEEFYEAFNLKRYDFYFGVDSGRAFDLSRYAESDLSRFGFWFIDFRHNYNRAERVPNDLTVAQAIHARGGKIFQAQCEDVDICSTHKLPAQWLPLAADPEIWSAEPVSPKKYQLGFVGNLWDGERVRALKALHAAGIQIAFPGAGRLWKEEAAALLRMCTVGFNISSWYGSVVAYDLNMRFFETLSCGIPIITNEVPVLEKVFATLPDFVRTYASLEELPQVAAAALQDEKFLNSGAAAREWICCHATYVQRMREVLTIFQHDS
jgi:Glycosyl transferases group 1